MESEARYTTVGAIVVALVVALVGAVLWLKQVGAERDFRYYTIYFTQQALDGLQVGGSVDMRGIRVGRVEDYALSNGGRSARVTIRVDRRVPVYSNTVAVVTRNLVTGIASIALETPEPVGKPLDQAPPNQEYPVIAEGRSNIEQLTGRVRQLGDLAGTALENFNALLNADNRAALTASIRNLNAFTAGLNARLGTVDQSLVAVGSAADSVRSAAERVASVADEFDRDLKPTLEAARKSLTDVGRAASAIERQIGTSGRRLDTAVASADDQLTAAIADLQSTLAATHRTLDDLQTASQNFAAPNRANLGPGEKLP